MPNHNTASIGKITQGIKPNTLLAQTVAFIERQLPPWRDDHTRSYAESEEVLNGQLCKFLNDRGRDEFPMAIFHHEEKQGTQRRVDLSALPSSEAISAKVYDSIYEPFLVMEGKRLPLPTSRREKEYITGFAEKSGGVQRFRLCLHGKKLSTAMLIGYIQGDDVKYWRKTINKWIMSLKKSGEDKTCIWQKEDKLGVLKNTGRKKTCRCESNHKRSEGAADICLVHLWIQMTPKLPKQATF